MQKFTFNDFRERFNTENKCLSYIMKNKYKQSKCPVCGKLTSFYKVKSKRFLFDTKCRHRFSALSDTSLKGIKTPLTTVFHIIFLLSIAKNGMSAKEVQRYFGMTYKTA